MPPFDVLPGSSAAAAAAEAGRKTYELTGFGSSLTPILEKYGVDPVTAAAVSAAGDQLAMRQDPAQCRIPMSSEEMSGLAESLVGSAVADPRVAGNQARNAVQNADPGLSKSELEALAATEAGDAAEAAGGDRALAEAKARDAMAQGVAPAMAAYAAAASAAATAVSGNPDSSPGIEIFGYLKALVQGLVTETYLAKETKTVQNATNWTIGATFVQTTTGTLRINCNKYLADAETDHVDIDHTMSHYKAGYEVEAPSPVFRTSTSVTAATQLNAVYWARTTSAAAYKRVMFILDIYAAALGTQNNFLQKNVTDKLVARCLLMLIQKNITFFH
ncbi:MULTISPECIES: hypothetical protein [Bordetella]|uniref:Uncharacterized protein n=1 Tax=Bordetella petrii TaxID=94624 RepID=A0ABT7W3J5_9BORD|nr:MULTISPECIES: hypothetical protein [Bordetella]MDM9559766.1 hypothetical protein [Bordetella petrii]